MRRAPDARVEAYRGGRREVQALGPAVDRHPHAVVGALRPRSPERRAPRHRISRRRARRARGATAGSCRSSSPCAVGGQRVSPAARQASSTAAASRSGRCGRWKTQPVDARTALPLCGSTVSPASTHGVGARRVGHADDRARVARDRRPRRSTATSAGGPASARSRRHVEEVADGEEALRGDGVGERSPRPGR